MLLTQYYTSALHTLELYTSVLHALVLHTPVLHTQALNTQILHTPPLEIPALVTSASHTTHTLFTYPMVNTSYYMILYSQGT